MAEVKGQLTNFIWNIIEEDLKTGKHQDIVTRFPPEPNGYLHIGHAKSICLNFGIAQKFKGRCHLRFDDTNPEGESEEYVQSIKEDIHWLGFDWGDHLYHASDYFDRLYELALQMIREGKAYVDSSTVEEIRAQRGSLTEAGRPNPYRERSAAESLELFEKMKNREFKEGQHVLRAKIDLNSPNMNMRDPVMYRIRYMSHPVAGDKWCVYPMYDWTHGLNDAFEAVTHSICTLEFEDHRPLYDWYIVETHTPCHPRQIEFARLNVNYTVTSKRRLKELVTKGCVKGWDDPRMPTIRGVRRRGYTPKSIRNFCDIIGVSKKDTIIDLSILEECVRQDLNESAPRRMAVLKPLRICFTNFKEPLSLKVDNHPQKPDMGHRDVPFTREIFVEREDFLENPPSDFFRLKPGGEVRLRSCYVIKCESVNKDEKGEVTELLCSIDYNTLGKSPEGRKVKGVIHWVSASESLKAEVRVYDRLFNVPNPTDFETEEFFKNLNSMSLVVNPSAYLEKSLAGTASEQHFQFERLGYFVSDRVDHRPDKPVFNRVVTLREGWKNL